MSRYEDLYTSYEIRFGSVNDTEALVFGYSIFTRFIRPLDLVRLKSDNTKNHQMCHAQPKLDLSQIIFTTGFTLHSWYYTLLLVACLFRVALAVNPSTKMQRKCTVLCKQACQLYDSLMVRIQRLQ